MATEAGSSRKRPLPESGDDNEFMETKVPSEEKRWKFPKGKKARSGQERAAGSEGEEAFGQWMNPTLAARERANRRYRKREEDIVGDQMTGGLQEILARSEVRYEENATFEDDGIPIEPFNLNQEREEGYIDESGNYIEYVRNEIKDAWLDSVDSEFKLMEQNSEQATQKAEEKEDYQDLSSADIAKIKRNISDILQPGETVIQALKRLKGTSGDKKQKMSEDTKRLFDQLTEHAMKLMENGEYDVYHEERETFDREAEGYERLARAREAPSNGNDEFAAAQAVFPERTGLGQETSPLFNTTIDPSEANAAQLSSADVESEFDMFGDDENDSTYPNPKENGQEVSAGTDNDYVYDESSGYYYNSSLGYYYDPRSGLYCSAASGKWYMYNEHTGDYEEVVEVPDAAPASAAPVAN